ncbi:MAG TPA: replicative DNA helicase [Steroidobacteraceae bacterium]
MEQDSGAALIRRRVRAAADADGLRVPPHSAEAEQAVLGGLMLDNSTWDAIADRLRAEDFYRRDHQHIFAAIAELSGRSEPSDAVTLAGFLAAKGLAEETGGLAYLAGLARDTPTAANIRAYADIVRERSVLRQLIRVSGEIAATAYESEGRAAAELVDEAERRVFEIAEQGRRSGSGFVPLRDVLGATIDRLDLLHQTQGQLSGVSTGYNDLDRMTAGLQPGDLVIVAGRPSMGKTTLALNIAEAAAISRNVPVAVFSMEMSREQLAFRMISSLGRVDQSHLRTGMFGDEDWARINSAIAQMRNAPIYIDDSGSLTPTEVRARARRLKRERGLGLIVIDYLQLMQVPGTKENRATEISEISRSIKALAKELQVPVIALSQLNRGVEQRTDKKPVMSDLRECVTGETLVQLANGMRRPIRDLVGQRPRVLAVGHDQKVLVAEADLVWAVGTRPVRRVSLASGRVLRATAEHKVLAGDGWRTVSELVTGTGIALARAGAVARKIEDVSSNPNVDTLPIECFDEVRQAMRAAGVSTRRMAAMRGTAYGGDSHFGFAPSRKTMASYAALLNDAHLKELAESDLYWDRVVAVEDDGEEEVYDLTVPGPESWLADGIVSHNSGALEQDADVIMLIYREEVYEPETPRKGIADIIIAKQRNGPTGEVHLTFLGKYTRFENLASGGYGYEP